MQQIIKELIVQKLGKNFRKRSSEKTINNYHIAKEFVRLRVTIFYFFKNIIYISLGIISAGFGLKGFLLPNNLMTFFEKFLEYPSMSNLSFRQSSNHPPVLPLPAQIFWHIPCIFFFHTITFALPGASRPARKLNPPGMNKKIIEYYTIVSNKPQNLDAEVEGLIKNGWEPQGGVGVCVVPSPVEDADSVNKLGFQYAQAMIKRSVD